MPIIQLVYANAEGGRALQYLDEERRYVKDWLWRWAHAPGAAGRYFYQPQDEGLDALLLDLGKPEMQHDLTVLGFSGHAYADKLSFGDSDARGKPLAGLLKQCPKLKLVLLNGCATAGHLQHLERAGVPLVITTASAVHDERAKDFAYAFFQQLALGEKTVHEAFEWACHHLSASARRDEITTDVRCYRSGDGLRDINFGDEAVDETGDKAPLNHWMLSYRNAEDLNWRLTDASPAAAATAPPLPAALAEDQRALLAAWQELVEEIYLEERQRAALPSSEVEKAVQLDQEIAAMQGRKEGLSQALESLPNASLAAAALPVFRARPTGLRLLFRILPWLDVRPGYWRPLEEKLLNISRQHLKALFKEYIQPSTFYLTGKKNLLSFAQQLRPGKAAETARRLKRHLHYFLLKGFLSPLNTDERFLLVLADAGVGKTSLLQKVFRDYARSYPPWHLAFAYAGEDTLARLRAIPDKADTILFLDALDEDRLARKQHLYAYLVQLAALLKQFHKVILTSRVQLFEKKEDEWARLHGRLKLLTIELRQFTEEEAERYLRQKYRAPAQREEALALLASAPVLFLRPLLLSWFDLLLESGKRQFLNLFEVYEAIAERWAERESEVAVAHDPQPERYVLKLLEFSKGLARNLHERRQRAAQVDEIHDDALVYGLKRIDARSRSFLTRERESDTFSFTHDSFLDYFLACALLDGSLAEPDFSFAERPQTEQFYEEACWLHYADLPKIPRDSSYRPLSLGDYWQLRGVYGRDADLIAAVPNRAVRAMAVRHRAALANFSGEPYGFRLVAFLATLCQDECEKAHFIFEDYRRFAAAKEQEQVPEAAASRFYLGLFLAEWRCAATYEKCSRALSLGQAGWHLEAAVPLLPPDNPVDDFGAALGQLLRYNPAFAARFADFDTLVLQGLGISSLNFLSYCPSLRVLRLSGNAIAALPEGLPSVCENLQVLDLADNVLSRFHGLPELRRLEVLRLENNRIAETHRLKALLEMPELLELGLAGNPLPGLPEPRCEPGDPAACLQRLRGQLLHPPDMIAIPGGVFQMGNRDGWEYEDEYYNTDWEKPVHEVQLAPFALGKYTVMFGEFQRFIEATGYQTIAEREGWSYALDETALTWKKKDGICWRHDAYGERQPNARHPVLHVSWYDAVRYCNWLSEEQGLAPYYEIDETRPDPNNLNDETTDAFRWSVTIRPGSKGYRLPTEAEWEYAARGGEAGARDNYIYAGSDRLDEVAWYWENSGDSRLFGDWSFEKIISNRCRTHPVGQKKPNQLGLYDMSGNVWEWCEDDWHHDYKDPPTDGRAWVDSPRASNRVFRGGSWYLTPLLCRAAYRGLNTPATRHSDVGFRLAL